MNGLYKRVLKGAYPEIPKKYTRDLADVIMKMLQVDPRLRPSSQQVLEMEQVAKRYAKLFPNEDDLQSVMDEINEDNYSVNDLLKTIRVPQNLAQLTKRLPKSNYSMKVTASSSMKKREESTNATSAVNPSVASQPKISNYQ